MYNKTLIATIEERLNKVQEYLFMDFNESEDLYLRIAKIIYTADFDNMPMKEVIALREKVKQFLMPIIIECDGISEEN